MKSSKEKLHIDFYYVFNLEHQNDTIEENIKDGKFLFVSRKELSDLIDKRQTHGDLLAIYDILVSVKNEMKPYPRISINNCTFTCKKKTAYWRITENCNCNCQYCFIENNKTHEDTKISDAVVQKVMDIIDDNNIEKLVISGGEPLLVDNLTNIVKEVSSANGGELKISICTNGLLDFNDFEKLSQIPQFQNIAFSRLYGRGMEEMVRNNLKYHYRHVFYLCELSSYQPDYATLETKEKAKILGRILLEVYKELGYSPIIVPQMDIKSRQDFIFDMVWMR